MAHAAGGSARVSFKLSKTKKDGDMEYQRGSGILARWKKGYCLLKTNGDLNVSKDRGNEKGAFCVRAKRIAKCEDQHGVMSLTTEEGESIDFRVSSEEELLSWIDAFNACSRMFSSTDAHKISTVEDMYELGEVLGEGVAGVVRIAQHRETGERHAIKTINKKKFLRTERAITTTRREIDIMKRLNEEGGHRHVVGLHTVFETSEHIHLVMELVTGGQLFDRVVELGCYTEEQAATTMFKLVSTLDFMHKKGILHRDLKPENILLAADSDTEVKLIDFGMSNTKSHMSGFLQSKCGTPVYMAPEMFDHDPKYDEGVDIWACGVLLYIMLSGALPFYSDDPVEFGEMLAHAEEHLAFHEEDWAEVSEGAKELIAHILVSSPAKRLKVSQILESGWLRRYADTT